MGEWVGEITLVREDVQVCWILHSSWAFHPAPAETEARWPLPVFVAALPLTWPVCFCPCACVFVLLVAPASIASWASDVSLKVWLCHSCFLWEGTRAHPQKGMSWVLKPVCNCLPETKESAWALAEPAKFTSSLGFSMTAEGKCSQQAGLSTCFGK